MNKKAWRRRIAAFLSVAMVLGIMPKISGNLQQVQAATSKAPDTDQFSTTQELMTSFDTDDDTSQPAKKVYFGADEARTGKQAWYIVGKDPVQGDNVVLFADSSMGGNISVASSGMVIKKTYSDAWGCIYDSNPTSVRTNHYGGSDLRLKYLKENGTNSLMNRFSDKEQLMMNSSQLSIRDNFNSNNYTVEDKLYLPAGVMDADYVTVGTSTSESANGTLNIDVIFCANESVWLRTDKTNDEIMYVWNRRMVDSMLPDGTATIQPAFDLNLTNIAFASSAQPAAAEGSVATKTGSEENPFTLRHTNETLGTVVIAEDAGSVNVSSVNGNGKQVYLMVQNKDGAYAKEVSSDVRVAAGDITIGGKTLTSLANCKVWLECTDDTQRITEATPAVSVTGYEITYRANGGSGSMALFTAVAGKTYTLPECGFTAPAGKRFLTWAIGSANSSVTRKPGENYTFTADTQVYATWETLTYTIAASDSEVSYPDRNEGYALDTALAAKTITITNTGNDTVTLSKVDAPDYQVSAFSANTLQAGETATFTIQPKTGLAAGNYNERVTVQTNHNTQTVIDAAFHVNGAFSVGITPDAATITHGDSQTLTAVPVGGSGNYTYQWKESGKTTVLSTENTLTVTPDVTTTYQVVVNDTIENTQMTATITVNPRKYQIAYRSNGATGSMETAVAVEDIPFVLPDNTFTAPEGYRFLEWAIGSADATVRKQAGESYVFTGDTDIYAVWELIPTYTIESDATEVAFDNRNENYADEIAAKTVTITNTGNSTVQLSKTDAPDYNVSAFVKTELLSGESTTFTVTPKAGLTAGNYNEAIVVSTDHDTQAQVTFKFHVNAPFAVGFTATAETITHGDSTTITANATGGSGTYTYQWYAGEETDAVSTEHEITVTPDITTTYRVVVNDTIEQKQTTATITVNPRRYTVSYDANGGTGSMESAVAIEETPFTVAENTFTAPEGYRFLKWAVGSADSATFVNAASTYTFTQNTTLYAVWELIPTYTIESSVTDITYANRNEGYTVHQTADVRTVTITNTGNSPVRLNKTNAVSYEVSVFDKETIDAGESATFTIQPKRGLTAGTYNETIVVTTQHNTSAEIPVTLVVNGALQAAVTPAEATITNGDSQVLQAIVTGGSEHYTYAWYQNDENTSFSAEREVIVNPSATTTYKVVVFDTIESVSSTATITVNPKKFEITYNANGGTESMESAIAIEETPFTVAENTFTAPEGYRFLKWAVGSADSETFVNAASTCTFTENTTLYAIWELIPTYTIQATESTVKFDDKEEGYVIGADLKKTVTITNTGNSAVELTNNTLKDFTAEGLENGTLSAGQAAVVTIYPNTGLKAGTYQEELTVATQKNTAVKILVGFVVKEKTTEAPTQEPTTEPITKPTQEPTTEPETEPTTEPETEPVTEPTTKPVTEPKTEPTTEPVTEEYHIIQGENGVYNVTEMQDYTVKCDGSIDKFIEVQMDDVTVDSSNYTVVSGSTIITFTQDYMNQLSTGKHSVKLVYTDGDVETFVTISKKAEQPTESKPVVGPTKESTSAKATEVTTKESTSAKPTEAVTKESTNAKPTEAVTKESTSAKATEAVTKESTSAKPTEVTTKENTSVTTTETQSDTTREEKIEEPHTGDSSRAVVWLFSMLLSFGMISVLFKIKKTNK